MNLKFGFSTKYMIRLASKFPIWVVINNCLALSNERDFCNLQNGDLEEPFEEIFDRQVQQIIKATEK